tara:strand:- start:681 stop:791 length:111 start_codon:yes stop_codon:yes gene_type:complete
MNPRLAFEKAVVSGILIVVFTALVGVVKFARYLIGG